MNAPLPTVRRLLATALLAASSAAAQDPPPLRTDDALTTAMTGIVAGLGLDAEFDTGEDGMEHISFAVVDLSGTEPRFAGVHADTFIYPASVYKMYVAAEVLRQVSQGRTSLAAPVIVRAPNDVDRTKELAWDPRPLLRDGDTVTVAYLLDLMVTRSDNSAANCLIDLARRENINAMMRQYGWNGSEVTRKYLSRRFEDSAYVKVRSTETCARHAAEFLLRIHTNTLADPWVSQQMRSLLGRQLDTTKLQTGLPVRAMFYHKTGWYASWTHDAGIVDDGTVRYIIACFLPLPEARALPLMRRLAEQVHAHFIERARLRSK